MAVRKLYDEDDIVSSIALDTSCGIPETEQKDILTEIEDLAGQYRCRPDQTDLKGYAKKRGVLFPILAAVSALLLLGSGAFLFFFFDSPAESEGETVSQYWGSSYISPGEWERSALIESELIGFYTAAGRQIKEGRFSEAVDTVLAMRELLKASELGSQKEVYLASVDILAEVIGSGLWGTDSITASPADSLDPSRIEAIQQEYSDIIADLREQNTLLEQTLANRDRTIFDLSGRSGNPESTPPDYEERLTALRNQNTNLQQSVTTLRSQNSSLQQQIGTLRSQSANNQQSVTALRSQNTNLQQTIIAHENTIKELRNQNETFRQSITARDMTLADLRTQNADLRSQNANLQQTAVELRNQSSTVQQNIGTRDSVISDLRSQNANLQQAVTELRNQNANIQKTLTDLRNQQTQIPPNDSELATLRSQNASLQQQVEQLKQSNEAVRRLMGNPQ
ncbi:MAG: hypothetical protein LBG90_03665 [Spirochaetaceae bacterium]|jgi:predicted nuclease with TOPRIM domain|nr:hypothetical protein [Spirochaetaceae bacterium]